MMILRLLACLAVVTAGLGSPDRDYLAQELCSVAKEDFTCMTQTSTVYGVVCRWRNRRCTAVSWMMCDEHEEPECPYRKDIGTGLFCEWQAQNATCANYIPTLPPSPALLTTETQSDSGRFVPEAESQYMSQQVALGLGFGMFLSLILVAFAFWMLGCKKATGTLNDYPGKKLDDSW
eukprot:TRINITY_DN24613_c0_g1_i1.p1 TRINITY_DN24613_c0_g1~~TRINITY_DN24613_c0_g1_i1.p1  ORF type:complete len:208 (+),score=68.25 TRINITY_DN24613_c0_g1_i1:95-625(+)